MGRKIVLTSGKGGVGKTTVTANLGIALAMQGKKVILVDADIGLNNLDVVMNVESKIVYDLGDIAEGRCRIRQALISDDFFPNLLTLPSAKAISSLSAKAFSSIINELANESDYVLIDCPAGIDEGFHRAVSASDEAIVVTTPHISAVRDADKVITLLSSYNVKSISLVVNRLNASLMADGKILDAFDIAKLLKITLKGAIPEDNDINVYSQIEKTENNRNYAQIAYRFLAEYIEGVGTKIFNCEAIASLGMFGRIKYKFRK